VARRGLAEDQGGALRRGAWICFVDESGASLVPPVRRTWAPRGHTPILRHRMRGRKRISMAGVCCYRPDASDARLAFHLREGAYDTDQLIPIVAALGRLVGGNAPVILVWDNLPAHHSIAMGAWLASQHAWLQVEYLPAYAPDLNPVEACGPTSRTWSWPTVPAVRWRSWPPRPSRASGGCAASPSCCSRSCTRQGFPCECHPISRVSVAAPGRR
jgi:DDE superfamily endonuclease